MSVYSNFTDWLAGTVYSEEASLGGSSALEKEVKQRNTEILSEQLNRTGDVKRYLELSELNNEIGAEKRDLPKGTIGFLSIIPWWIYFAVVAFLFWYFGGFRLVARKIRLKVESL